MEVELLEFLISKAQKIYRYEQQPRTDEQYLYRKKYLLARYKKAKDNYLLTSLQKYKDEMKKFKKYLSLNVSQIEYELCRKIIEEYKENYCDVIDKKFWNYFNLIEIDIKIKICEAKSVKEAVEIYKEEIEDTIDYYNDAF